MGYLYSHLARCVLKRAPIEPQGAALKNKTSNATRKDGAGPEGCLTRHACSDKGAKSWGPGYNPFTHPPFYNPLPPDLTSYSQPRLRTNDPHRPP